MNIIFISDQYFSYDGHQSYLYGLRFAWVEKSPETIMVSPKTYSHIRNKTQKSFTIIKTDHDEPLSFEAEMISDRVLVEPEVRRIYNQFFNKNQYKKLELVTNSGETVYLNAIITEPERIEGGVGDKFGVVGFSVKIVCDAPWGWTNTISSTIKFVDSVEDIPNSDDGITYAIYSGDSKTANFSIYNYSDSQDYIYPTVTITTLPENEIALSNKLISDADCTACYYRNSCRNAGAVPNKSVIINKTDSWSRGTCIFWDEATGGNGISMKIKLQPASGLIREVGANNVNRISNTNKRFVRLLPGENIFEVENIDTITFEFKEARILV